MIREAQWKRFPGDLPTGFGCLRGPSVDLGFDRLGLEAAELDAVLLAFVGFGVAVPGAGYRVRFVRPVPAVVEPAGRGEGFTLPEHLGGAFSCRATTGSPPGPRTVRGG